MMCVIDSRRSGRVHLAAGVSASKGNERAAPTAQDEREDGAEMYQLSLHEFPIDPNTIAVFVVSSLRLLISSAG